MLHKCWTADRLKKGGSIILKIVFYVIKKMKLCSIFYQIGLSIVASKRRDSCFAEWWRKASARIPKSKRKGFNSVVILGAWSLWKQRNRCIFYGARPCLSTSEDGFKDEMWLWFSATAKNMHSLFYPG